jgi:nucleotide-binding universal stress UspA family protein
MAILCGTDFTEAAATAAQVAGRLAARLSVPLRLVHVVPRGEREEPEGAAALERLRIQAGLLEGLGAEVSVSLLEGTPDAALAAAAAGTGARVAIVGAGGAGGPLGRTADRLAHRGTVPVLVLRPGAAIEAWMEWLRGGTPLRVLVASDLGRRSDAAIEWVARLREAGPVRATLLHVFDPRLAARRTGTVEDPGEGAYAQRALRADLEARCGHLEGAAVECVPLVEGAGVVGGILERARALAADLVVAGTHQRRGLRRAWRGSVAGALLGSATVPVSIVPMAGIPASAIPVPPMDRVVAATDLSDAGNAAVAHAYSLVPPGGTVILLHVLDLPETPSPLYAHYTPPRSPRPGERSRRHAEADAALRALVPADAEAQEIRTRILVLEGKAAAVIARAAERHAVDAVCVGSRGRSALAKAVLGSVAASLLGRCRRPVLVVPPDREN